MVAGKVESGAEQQYSRDISVMNERTITSRANWRCFFIVFWLNLQLRTPDSGPPGVGDVGILIWLFFPSTYVLEPHRERIWVCQNGLAPLQPVGQSVRAGYLFRSLGSPLLASTRPSVCLYIYQPIPSQGGYQAPGIGS